MNSTLPMGLVLFLALALPPSSTRADDPPQLLWSQLDSRADWPPAVAAAPGGGVYFANPSSSFPSQGVLARYDASGAQAWRKNYASDRPTSVRVDATGALILSGAAYSDRHGPNAGHSDMFVESHSPAGALNWGTQYGTVDFDSPIGLAADRGGNTLVLSAPWASNYGTPTTETFTNLSKFGSDGSLLWRRNLDTGDGTYPGFSTSGSMVLAVDDAGYSYAQFSNYLTEVLPSGGHRIDSFYYLSKVSPDGDVVWLKELDPVTNHNQMIVNGDNLYLTSSLRTLAFDTDGNQLWERSHATPILARYNSATPGAKGGVILGGSRNRQGALLSLDRRGDTLWAATIPIPTGYDNLEITSVDLLGNRLAVGGHLLQSNSWAGSMAMEFRLVPEPASGVLLIGGLAGCALRRRR